MRNEGHVLQEWLEHYAWQGVDAAVVLDNNSSMPFDGTAPPGGGMSVDVISAPKMHAQEEHYNALGLPRLRALGVDVAIISDMDEFWFSKEEERNLAETLSDVFADASVSHTCVFWTSLSSSGHTVQPPSVRLGFYWRQAETDPMFKKCAIRLSAVSQLGQHEHAFKGIEVPAPSSLQLNHYYLQSKAFYNAVKAKRGDAMYPDRDTIRDANYWAERDAKTHGVEDYALATLLLRWYGAVNPGRGGFLGR